MGSGYFPLGNTRGSIRRVLRGRDAPRSPAASGLSPWKGQIQPQNTGDAAWQKVNLQHLK